MATVCEEDQNNAMIPVRLSATTEHVRRSWMRFERATSVIERLADLAAVIGATLIAHSD
jgi:hypothetical protein